MENQKESLLSEFVKPLTRPNHERAKYVLILLYIIFVLDFVSSWSSYIQYDLLLEMKNGFYSVEAATSNDNRQQLIGLIYMACYIISGILFIRWFQRAYYNLGQRFASTNHSVDHSGWCWFVPILNLFRPFELFKEMWGNTQSRLKEFNESFEITPITIPIIWWILWVIGNVSGSLMFHLARHGDTIDDLILSSQLELVTSILSLPLAILAILIVKQYSSFETKLEELENQKLSESNSLLK